MIADCLIGDSIRKQEKNMRPRGHMFTSAPKSLEKKKEKNRTHKSTDSFQINPCDILLYQSSPHVGVCINRVLLDVIG